MSIKRGVLWIGACFFSISLLAQEMPKIKKVAPKEQATAAKPAKSATAPKIVVEKDVHDFGKIDKGQPVNYSFKFRNEGKGILEIMDVKTSCGCTSAKPEKRVYQPGEKGEIAVSFNPSRFQGPITKSVTILTNDPVKPRYVCKIQAQIIVEVMVTPRVLFIQNLKRNETREQKIVVSTEKMDKLDVTDLKVDRDFVKISLERVNDQKFEINAVVDGSQIPKDQKRLFANVSYKTNSKGQSQVQTRVHVTIQDPVEVQPPAIYLFGSKKGFERELKVRLRSTIKSDLDIKNLNVEMTPESAKEFVTAEVVRDEKTGIALKVKLSENAQKGKFQGKITFKTGMEEQPEVMIPLKGSVI